MEFELIGGEGAAKSVMELQKCEQRLAVLLCATNKVLQECHAEIKLARVYFVNM